MNSVAALQRGALQAPRPSPPTIAGVANKKHSHCMHDFFSCYATLIAILKGLGLL